MRISALLKLPAVRGLVYAPDIGKLQARGSSIVFENAILPQAEGESDPRVDTLMTFGDIEGQMGTKIAGEQIAELVASVLNRLRDQARRELVRT